MREPPDVRVPVSVSVEQSAELSVEQVAALRRAAAPGIDAPDARLARDRALAALGDLYARRGVTLRPEHHAWARKVLGVTVDPATDPAGA
jgi:hypothetical protein